MWKTIAISALRWTAAYCLFLMLALVFLMFAWPRLLRRRRRPGEEKSSAA